MPGRSRKTVQTEEVDLIGAPVKGLEKLSEELSLNRDEMIMLAHYFRDLGRNPTMLEILS